MSESFNLIYSYTRAQAIEDGVLLCHGGDDLEPVITIMFPEED